MAEINVNIKGKLYPINQLIGKTIYAGNVTPLYPYINGKPLFQVQPGNVVGQMYSWNTANDGTVYLSFYTNSAAIKDKYSNGYYIVKLSDINGDTLQTQGAKTTEQLKAEAESQNKTFADKALETGTKIVLWSVAIFALSGIVKSSINK